MTPSTSTSSRDARIPAWLRELEFIRAFFTWFFMLLARLAEPLLMLSVIYVIVEQAVKPLHSQAIEYTAIAIMVSAPEVMIAGSFKIAAVAKAQGQKLATLLYITCWLFIALLLMTIADVLIFHLSGVPLQLLMFFRCAVAVGYSIIMRVMPHQDEASELTEKFSEQLTRQVESITAAAESKLSEFTQKFSSEFTSLIDQAQTDRLSLASISETTEAHSIALASLTGLPGMVERQSQTLRQAMQDLRVAIEETKSSALTIDYEALTEAATQQVEVRFEAAMRQHITITEAKNEAHEAGHTRQIEAPKARREAKPAASRGGSEASTKVLTLRQRGEVPSEKRAAVYSLLDTDDRLSSYEIAEKTGYPPSTIQRYMKDWKVRQAEAEGRAAREATDTAM